MNPWKLKAIERHGTEVVVSELPGWLFRVRRSDKWNGDYQRAIVRLAAQRAVRDMLERQAAPDYEPSAADVALDARITLEAFTEGCLAGWEGVTDEAGAPLPFSLANAVKVLETFPEVAEALQRAAANPANFPTLTDDHKEAAVLGNSEGASSSKTDRGAKRSQRAPAATAGT